MASGWRQDLLARPAAKQSGDTDPDERDWTSDSTQLLTEGGVAELGVAEPGKRLLCFRSENELATMAALCDMMRHTVEKMTSTAEIVAVVGLVSAITIDIIRRRLIKTHIGNGGKRVPIRKAVYDELEVIYSIFDSTRQISIYRPELDDLTVKVLTSVGIDAYKSAKSEPEVFNGLKEAEMIDALYSPVTTLKTDYVLPGMGRPAMELRDQFIELFERALNSNTLDVQLFSPSFVQYVHVSKKAIGQPAGTKESK